MKIPDTDTTLKGIAYGIINKTDKYICVLRSNKEIDSYLGYRSPDRNLLLTPEEALYMVQKGKMHILVSENLPDIMSHDLVIRSLMSLVKSVRKYQLFFLLRSKGYILVTPPETSSHTFNLYLPNCNHKKTAPGPIYAKIYIIDDINCLFHLKPQNGIRTLIVPDIDGPITILELDHAIIKRLDSIEDRLSNNLEVILN